MIFLPTRSGRRPGMAVHDVFNPIKMFSGGDVDGVLIDFQTRSSLFEDSALTTPASVDGSLGGIKDLSGNGHHFTQATAAEQPTLKQTAGGVLYLDPDGTDDRLSAGDVLKFGTNNFSVVFVIDKTSTGVIEDIISKRGSGAAGVNQGWGVRISNGEQLQLEFDDGSANGPLVTVFSNYPTGLHVCSVTVDRSAATVTGYLDGVEEGSADISAFGDVSGNNNLTIGTPNSFPIQSNFYEGFIIGKLLSDVERAKVEHWMAARTGVALPFF